jgi:hypothetical protein
VLTEDYPVVSTKEMVRAGMCRALALSVGIGLMALAGCKVPEAPEWDVAVVVPFASDPIGITDLLPSQVQVVDVGGQNTFTVAPEQSAVTYSLGQMCSSCGILQGMVAAVPTFDYVDSLDVPFDPELVSIELLSAHVGLRIDNNLNFDPLRPGAGGYLAIAIHDLYSGATLDSIFIDGDASSLPAGTSMTIDANLAGTMTDGIRAVFYIHSPNDGQTVSIDNSLGAGFDAVLDQIQVTAVTVVVDALTMDEQFDIGFSDDLQDDITDRVQSGEYELQLNHTAELDGTLGVSIAGSPTNLFSSNPALAVNLNSLTFTSGAKQTGVLTASEIDLITGFATAYLGYRGVASGTRTDFGRTELSRFTPDAAIQANFKLTITMRVGQ